MSYRSHPSGGLGFRYIGFEVPMKYTSRALKVLQKVRSRSSGKEFWPGDMDLRVTSVKVVGPQYPPGQYVEEEEVKGSSRGFDPYILYMRLDDTGHLREQAW